MKKLIKSFGYALSGLQQALVTERNMRIHFIISIIVIVTSIWLDISTIEWIMVLCCIGWIISLELINTAIEAMCDTITRDISPAIKKIKDISAAAVLWSSVIVAIVGTIIFLPKIVAHF